MTETEPLSRSSLNTQHFLICISSCSFLTLHISFPSQSPSTRFLSAFWWFFSLVMLLLYLIELHAILNVVTAVPGDVLGDVGLLDVVNGEGIDSGIASGDFHARLDALGEDTLEVGCTS